MKPSITAKTPEAPHSPPTRNPHTYRPDLDGLRGIAIALVVVFHVYVGRVSGGVDIFLLLSGYFFLGSQLRAADNPKSSLNPLWPLWRTARRLLPNLVVVVFSCTALAATLFPQLRNLDMAKQVRATILYFQNIELTDQAAAYQAVGSTVSPLQHLWSMSVQGQFYLICIVGICAIGAFVRIIKMKIKSWHIVLPLLIFGSITSFIIALHLHAEDQIENYYSTWSRVWELFLGGILICLSTKTFFPSSVARVAAPIGLVMVLTTGLLFDGAEEFPGPGALYPLAGAVLVILSARATDSFTYQFLSSRPMIFLGQIAYALYLWHWPLLIFSLLLFDVDKPSFLLGTSVIACSILLAWLTHRLIERPLMQHRKRPKRDERARGVIAHTATELRSSTAPKFRLAGGIIVLVGALILVQTPDSQRTRIEQAVTQELNVAQYPGVLSNAPSLSQAMRFSSGLSNSKTTADLWDEDFWVSAPENTPPQPKPDMIRDLIPRSGVDRCITYQTEDADLIIRTKQTGDDAGSRCIYGDPKGTKTVALVGGSHAEAWFTPVNKIARERGWKLVPILRQGCSASRLPIAGVDPNCAEFGEAILHEIDRIHPDLVVTTSTRPSPDWSADWTPPGMIDFWDQLAMRNIGIIGLRDTPWFRDPDDISQDAFPTQCVAEGEGDADSCGTDRLARLSPINPADEPLSQYPKALSVDLSDLLCDAKHCPAIIGNIYAYRDSNHLSNELATSMYRPLRSLVNEFWDSLENPEEN